MPRLIDADLLMPNAEYKGRYDTVNAYDIVNCPTVDAVEVVRCKDCKYHSYWCEEHETRVPLDAYCWLGEREEKAELVRHGHWKEDGARIKDQCSVCGLSVNWSQYKTPYCPFCGAKMDEERK